MRPPLRLNSLDNPRVKAVVVLRNKQRERRESGRFLAEGLREVSRALGAGLALHELFFCPELLQLDFGRLLAALPQLSRLARAPNIFEVPPALVAKMSYCENPEGMIGVFDQPRWTLEDVGARHGADSLYLVASGTEKPGNLGAIARSAAAAGAAAVLAADAEVDPFNPNAIRASTGAVFALPVISGDSQAILDFLREWEVSIITATPDATMLYTDADLANAVAIVIGAEDTGVSAIWREAGSCVRIPMAESVVDSLNASTSAAIMLFEAVRQRAATRP